MSGFLEEVFEVWFVCVLRQEGVPGRESGGDWWVVWFRRQLLLR